MLTEKQIDRMLSKLSRFLNILEPLIFEKRGELKNVKVFETTGEYHEIPKESLFTETQSGFKWGGESHYCWFKSLYKVPKQLAGKDLFLRPHVGGYEAMLWVDGVPFGTFASKIVFTGHGNHYCDLIVKNAKEGQIIEIAVEYYAGHSYKGCAPLDNDPEFQYDYTYERFDICVKNNDIAEYYFDLEALVLLEKALEETSFRKAEIINALYRVHNELYYSYEDIDKEDFIKALKRTKPILEKALKVKNGPDAPKTYVIGHSHMDTAWLWHVGETIKKCARTYSNQISLMQQYEDYKFIQSSACHSNFILQYYPALFKRIQQAVKENKYEPNGGVWVECDCNITGGESMIRQFLWGQRFTREHFNYTSNCFWLPDTFGYSAALPQIMKSCGVDYFLTTKIGWNDTNVFPYDTFWWQGIDGTSVFTHFNRTHMPPSPDRLIQQVNGKGAGVGIKEKTVNDKLLIAFGYGDGGGGPQFEQIEQSIRAKDLNGCPKTEYTLVGDFMKELEKTSKNPNVFKGELYLELHRGTLTNQHEIKRNNRKAELGLRDLEIFAVNSAVKTKQPAKSDEINQLWELMLINQFHDILPGTCIPRAHKESKAQTSHIIRRTKELIAEYAENDEKAVTFTNTLSFDRDDALIAKIPKGYLLECDYPQQAYENLDGEYCVIVSGFVLPAFSSVTFKLKKSSAESLTKGEGKVFRLKGNSLLTRFAKIKFDKRGYISSFIDLSSGRELVGGMPFNTFIIAEDLPSSWDNWDVDADIEGKFKDCAQLVSRETVSRGALALVIRSKYRITPKSTITQDMMFFSNSKQVRFDLLMDWHDDHRFLKAVFDTSIMQDFTRCEIQFGYVRRPTTRNTSIEKAKFEVLNHKYTDISESRFGCALLNDCKYALSVEGGAMKLSLHKGGTRPDFTGDHGKHRCAYSFLPHDGDFSAKTVVRPAYEFNIPAVVTKGEYKADALILPEYDNIIVESVKPCEDSQRAFIARLYECEGGFVNTKINFFEGAKSVQETNMLEEPLGEIIDVNSCCLTFKPFEIKTVKVFY
ncbi:MAG: Mannosylglycerate hydrolase [Firmicutes bacterium ADurb.Bin300]|nr:MAG: Mannosylglycerate hydrolase [Firmicutes bacterium ADurb.Bin300]